jgi:hypothetical protein
MDTNERVSLRWEDQRIERNTPRWTKQPRASDDTLLGKNAHEAHLVHKEMLG